MKSESFVVFFSIGGFAKDKYLGDLAGSILWMSLDQGK